MEFFEVGFTDPEIKEVYRLRVSSALVAKKVVLFCLGLGQDALSYLWVREV